MNQVFRQFTRNASSFSPLVSTHFLKEQMSRPDFSKKFKILDVTWDFPSSGRDLKQEFQDKRIPEAVFFDLTECRNKNTSLPNMLPSTDQFEEYATKLGIGNDDHVIVYDNHESGLFSATRAWWMFRVFGHNLVSLLDGGLPKWVKDEFPVQGGDVSATGKQLTKAPFKADFQPQLIKDLQFMKNNLKKESMVPVVDARSHNIFHGLSASPHASLRSGHIPRSLNVPFKECLDPETKVMKPPEQLRALFAEKGINVDKEFVATCGSGITATILAFSAYSCCGTIVPVYDGSWNEWARMVKDE